LFVDPSAADDAGRGWLAQLFVDSANAIERMSVRVEAIVIVHAANSPGVGCMPWPRCGDHGTA
jgi:hypothetical protein